MREKYGKISNNYFEMTKRNIESRCGLLCHNIDEDKMIMLTNNAVAKSNGYKYQIPEKLVYCNMLEHLLLHIKIMEDFKIDGRTKLHWGVGDTTIICRYINDCYNNPYPKSLYTLDRFNQIRYNMDDYVETLQHIINISSDVPLFKYFVSKEKLSLGSNGKIVDKIYKRL